MKKAFLFFLALLIAQTSWAQEICDNGLDDDNDGLIDLNDTDCECISGISTQPSSLIPNPSFEDNDCIPTSFGQLDCADDWIQASEGTSDYFHVDGFMPPGFNIPQPPLPAPDGDGFVGFYNNNNYINNVYTLYKEYVGACLLAPMEVGTEYTFEYYLGFSTPYGGVSVAPNVEICIYGSVDCADLPFLGYDCPSSAFPGQWEMLDCVTVTGQDEWVLATQSFTALAEYETLILGPNCVAVGEGIEYYYYLDNLVVNESALFGIDELAFPEVDCDGSFVLTADEDISYSYQWYLDGVALAGETGAILEGHASQAGTYQVLIEDGQDCSIAQLMVDPDIWELPTLTLEVENPTCDSAAAELSIEGEFDEIYVDGELAEAATMLLEAGSYAVQGIYGNNCEISQVITVPALPDFDVSADQQIIMIGESTTSEITSNIDASYSFDWSPAEGLSCTTCQFPVFSPTENTVYTLTMTDPEYGCSSASTVSIEVIELPVVVNENCIVNFPNAFSPNGDGMNDVFRVLATGSCEELTFNAMVFDRWGKLIIEHTALAPGEVLWDGTRNGVEYPLGAYVIYSVYTDAQGNEVSYGSHITLVK